jgi:hypothetical protein
VTDFNRFPESGFAPGDGGVPERRDGDFWAFLLAAWRRITGQA